MIFLGVLALAVTGAASAHAYLVKTNPASGAVLQASPRQVTLVFDENVATNSGALGVYDANGNHVDSGAVLRPAGDTVAIAIPTRLKDGTYTVAWRVTSADTHVVHGAFTFSVGVPGASGGIASKLEAEQRIPASVSLPFTGIRFLNFLLILAVSGGALTLVAVFRRSSEPVRRSLTGLLVPAAALLALMAVAGLPLEAAESAGSGLWGGFAASAISAVRHLRFGEVWLLRAWIALAIAAVAFSLEHRPTGLRGAREGLLTVLAVALLFTPSASGHADIAGPLAFAADAAHVAAASVWFGGLLFVVLGLALAPEGRRWPLAAETVPRFSTFAVGAVAVLVVAGVLNAYLEVRAWRGLWESTYGELVLAKVALVLPLIALGAFNNRISVPRLRQRIASRIEKRRFLAAVGVELILLVAVLAVTAVLVDEPLAKDVIAQKAAASTTATTTVGPYTGKVTLTPGTAGTNTIELTFADKAGKPANLAEVDVAASLPSKNIGPLRYTARRTAPGAYTVSSASFAIAGNWRLELTVRRGAFDEWLKTIPIQIRKGRTQ